MPIAHSSKKFSKLDVQAVARNLPAPSSVGALESLSTQLEFSGGPGISPNPGIEIVRATSSAPGGRSPAWSTDIQETCKEVSL